MKVADAPVTKALQLAQGRGYQLACCAVYESLHGKKQIHVTAPHQYFAESRKHYQESEEQAAEGAGKVVEVAVLL